MSTAIASAIPRTLTPEATTRNFQGTCSTVHSRISTIHARFQAAPALSTAFTACPKRITSVRTSAGSSLRCGIPAFREPKGGV